MPQSSTLTKVDERNRGRRDPLSYLDSQNEYLYVKSNPISSVDPSGLQTYGQMPAGGESSKATPPISLEYPGGDKYSPYWWKLPYQPLYLPDPGFEVCCTAALDTAPGKLATTACCGGRKVGCINTEELIESSKGNAAAMSAIADCAMKHELRHFWEGPTGNCAPDHFGSSGWSERLSDNPAGQAEAEKGVYAEEAACLQDKINAGVCDSDKSGDCLGAINERIGQLSGAYK